MRYQLHYSSLDPSMLESDQRKQKAQKIIAILRDYCQKRNKKLTNLHVLEIGCSAGGMTVEFSRIFQKVVAVDLDTHALAVARKKHMKKNITYRYADALHLPFKNAAFDVVILNHVYEHVPDAAILLRQVYRVLQKRGFCYFSGPQKYSIIEPHYHIPFLSWIPKRLVPFYYETLRSPGDLRSLVAQFTINDYTLAVMKEPKKFFASHPFSGILSFVPAKIYALLYPFLPSFFWVLEKKT